MNSSNSVDSRESSGTRSSAPTTRFYVLDRDYRIVSSVLGGGSDALSELLTPVDGRLPKVVEESIRDVASKWDLSDPATCVGGQGRDVPGILINVVPMSGVAGAAIGVHVEAREMRCSSRAARAYNLSRREREITRLLLRGYTTNGVAAELFIAVSTVRDHIKRLILKTESRNRVEMIARLLGWSFA